MTDISTRDTSSSADCTELQFASNEIRLSLRQWLILGALFMLVPSIGDWVVPLKTGADYRLPHRLGEDYWTYRRYCRQVCRREQTLVVGDSVIWGHYVAKAETLPHYLNQLVGQERFANLAVDGIHPAALAGLVEHYGTAISGKDVILNCNLLWMADQRRDLQSDTEFSFNHPELVPQFSYHIPCYRESFLGRMGIVLRRELPLLGWARHVQIAYFDSREVSTWTMEHPYENPVQMRFPSPDDPPSPPPIAQPWTKRKDITPRNFPWVELDTSLQWRFFRQVVQALRARGNRVFVLLGPFNEHMLTPQSLEVYQERQGQVEAWLRHNQIAYYIPPALPSQHYADASHPLAEGYRLLAERLLGSPSFLDFCSSAAYNKRD